ncbi:MAG: pyrroloquinoline quinone biosynthesis protein [Methanolobus sp.]|nr:pyrroloquinoline quinone biosynthesis protein [Methanolobus sp.]
MELFEDKPIDEVYVQKINIRWRWDGEDKDYIVYMSPFSGHINILNPVGADIFMLCDGKHTISTIVNALLEIYEGASREQVTNDVIDLIKYLKKENLISIFS